MEKIKISQADRILIWRQFLKIFLIIAVIVLVIGLVVSKSLIASRGSIIESNQQFLTEFGQRRVLYSINVTKSHLKGLVREDAFQLPANKTNLKEIERALKSLILRNPRYAQARLLDLNGQELVRVDNVSGTPVVTSAALLQDKSDRPYFQIMSKLHEGEIYVSPIDLNVENGKIEIPYNPMIRIGIKLPDAQDKVSGVLVINLYATHFFHAMNDSVGKQSGIFLLNSDGYWLKGPKPEDEWGFVLGKANSLATTHPKLWQSILHSKLRSTQDDSGLWSWAWSKEDVTSLYQPKLLTLSLVPKHEISEIRNEILISMFSIVIPLLSFIGMGLYRFFVSQLIARKVSMEVDRLEAETKLANKINQVSQLFQKVVQASPVGKIVVGSNGRISMVNPIVLTMFGYSQEELLGEEVHQLIPEELRLKHRNHVSSFLKDAKTRPMGAGETLWGLRKNGTRIPLEIGLTKLDLDDESSVMVTLSDLSLRYELIKDNARYESLIKNSSNFVAVCEMRGNFIFINQAGIEMLGLQDVDVSRLAPNDLLSTESQFSFNDDFWAAIAQNLKSDLELCFLNKKTGQQVWLGLNVFSIHDSETDAISLGFVGQNQTEKRVFIQELSESKSQWENLAEAMPQFVWTCAANGQCDYLNKKWLNYTGIDLESQLGFGWLNQIHPDDQEMLSDVWGNCVKNKVDLDVEFRIRRNDGEYRWFKTRGVPIFDTNGEIVKWYGSNTDIQQLKKTQEALSLERNTLATWFDTSPIALWEVNSSKAIAYITSVVKSGISDLSKFFSENAEARAQLLSGVIITDCNAESVRMREADSKDSLCGSFWDISVSENCRRDYTEMILDSYSGATIRNRPVRAATLNGRELQLYVSLTVTNEEIEERRAILAETDVTEKVSLEAELDHYRVHLEELVKQRTNELENVNHFLGTVANSLPVLIGYWDKNQKCQFANRFYLPTFGIGEVDAIGRDMRDVIGEDLYTKNQTYIQAALNGVPQRFERAITKIDGSVFYTITNYIPDVKDGKVVGFFVLSSDITDLKIAQIEMSRLNEELIERSKQAENANKAKSDFVANMSHEIRTPMNAVLGMTHLLLDTELDEQQFSYLSKIRTASTGLMTILNDILDYSKMEAGRLDIEYIKLDLESLLDTLSDVFSITASTKNIELIFEVNPKCPKYIVSDPLRLSQILNNLVGNALKFTSSGYILIKVNYLQEPSSEIHFQVIDTGIGMSEEQAAHIFNPFTQADTSTTRKFGGTGLGLSICQHLVKLMQGSIGVISELNKGSTFWFKLPVQVDNALLDNHIYGNLNKRVLVVDDSSESRAVLSTYLEHWKISVTLAEDAESGLNMILQAHADKQPFDLLLLDWKMPKRSGLWLADQVRKAYKRKQLKRLPVIAMVTAHNRQELLQEADALELMPEAILTKPVTPSRLYNLVLDLNVSGVKRITDNSRDSFKRLEAAKVQMQGLSVLVVEDNQMNQEVAQAILQKMGIVVEIANNGQEAVDLVSHKNYDIILMDLQMPVLDGFEATKIIRNNLNAKLPIIALTAAAFGEDKEKAIAAGMSDHLAKPINTNELVYKLLEWMPKDFYQEDNLSKLHAQAVDDLSDSLPRIEGINIPSSLKRTGLDWSVFKGFILRFAGQFADWPSQMLTALDQNEMETAIRLAHTLKGAAGNIGAEYIAAKASLLEKGLHTNDWANFEDVKLNLERLILKVNEALVIPEQEPIPPVSLSESEINNLLQNLENLLGHHKIVPKSELKLINDLYNHRELGQLARQLVSEIDKFNFKEALATILKMKKVHE